MNKPYHFCSPCQLVSSESDDASVEKSKKRTKLGQRIGTQEHYVKRQHTLSKNDLLLLGLY